MSISREFLMLIEESAFLTPNATPVVWPTASANCFYLRLDGANAFSMRPRPAQVPIMYGGGVNVEAQRIADKWDCTGTLRQMLWPGQVSAFLLAWAGNRITGGTSPWTTTEINGDLASVACYHGIIDAAGNTKRRVYLGTKVKSWSLTIGENSPIAMLTLNLVASTPQGNTVDSSSDPTAGTFPVPTDAQLPLGPYIFFHAGTSGAGLYIGAQRTKFQSLTISCDTDMIHRFWTSHFVQLQRMTGRHATLTAEQLYTVGATDDRYEYENLVAQTPVTFKLNNGANTCQIDMKSTSVFTEVEDMLPQNDLYLQRTTITNLWDATAGTDFVWTFS